MNKSLESIKFNEIQEFSPVSYSHDLVVIIGAPFKNIGKPGKILISPTIFSNKKIFYEIDITDIIRYEEMDNLVDNDGESVSVIKLFVKRGSKALKLEQIVLE